MRKKFLMLLFGILLFGSFVFLIQTVSATVCAEKTLSGAWCQDVEMYEVDTEHRYSQTSCDATSYCKLGTCINNEEGTCTGNTAQKTCEQNNGFWKAGKPVDIPQCQKGCCLMGDQASFVTQTRCKMFASLYSVTVDFRTNLGNEFMCLSSITSDVKGACVFGESEEFGRTCNFVTQKECLDSEGEFHTGILCSAESLNTVCGPSDQTTCIPGKDEVYFVDTCGNIANVYDSSRRNDPTYWTSVVSVENSCGYGSSNADSKTCGNCDYFSGSTCKAYKRGQDVSPSLGDNICRNLDCKYEGKTYSHGETWCATDTKNNDLPGSQHYVLKCYNNEVTVEPCAVKRAEVCIQESVEDFTSASCRTNMWQDCTSIDNEKDCLNDEQRYCEWVKDYEWNTYPAEKDSGVCVPKYAPGFDFWNAESEAESICGLATVTCEVKYEKGLLDGWDVVANEECLPGSSGHKEWLNKMENVCSAIGDCGSSLNYIKQKGYNELNVTKV